MAICMDDILIKGSFSPQMYCYAPGTTLLFLALDWCLIWERDISFPNLQATHFWLWPILALFWMTAPWPPLRVPVYCLYAGVWRTLSLYIVLRAFMVHRGLWVHCHLLDAALQCLSEAAPKSISFCLLLRASTICAFKGHYISCLREFSFLICCQGFFSNRGFGPYHWDLDRYLLGQGSFWKLGLLRSLWGFFWA